MAGEGDFRAEDGECGELVCAHDRQPKDNVFRSSGVRSGSRRFESEGGTAKRRVIILYMRKAGKIVNSMHDQVLEKSCAKCEQFWW